MPSPPTVLLFAVPFTFSHSILPQNPSAKSEPISVQAPIELLVPTGDLISKAFFSCSSVALPSSHHAGALTSSALIIPRFVYKRSTTGLFFYFLSKPRCLPGVPISDQLAILEPPDPASPSFAPFLLSGRGLLTLILSRSLPHWQFITFFWFCYDSRYSILC